MTTTPGLRPFFFDGEASDPVNDNEECPCGAPQCGPQEISSLEEMISIVISAADTAQDQQAESDYQIHKTNLAMVLERLSKAHEQLVQTTFVPAVYAGEGILTEFPSSSDALEEAHANLCEAAAIYAELVSDDA